MRFHAGFWAVCCAVVVSATAAPPMREDLVYATRESGELKFDFLEPEGKGPFPLVVCIHGGAWHLGSKRGHHRMMRLLAENGYAAA